MQVIRLIRPIRCAAWCCFCCLQEIEVQSPPGTTIGWVKQDCTFLFPWYSVQNADGETVLKIKGPCWQCKWCDIEFQVYLFMFHHDISLKKLKNLIVTIITMCG